MKKLLAIVLAAAMLCSFACIGASALTPEEELLEEALGYIAQAAEILESGTFTLKGKRRLIGPGPVGNRVDMAYSENWVYDKENDKKMLEIDYGDMARVKTSLQGVGFGDRVLWYFIKVIYHIVDLLVGSKIRGIQVGTEIIAAFPNRFVYSDDVAEFLSLIGLSFYDYLDFDFYIFPRNILEVKKEGNRVSLLYGYGDYSRLYEFTDGNFTFYREVWPEGEIHEKYIDFLSPEADQSYFSTKGMMKIPLGWLAGPIGWLENQK